MILHRVIPSEFAGNRLAAFSGDGGLHGFGRWHTKGTKMVYAAETIALSALENLLHVKRTAAVAPYSRFVVDIPDASIERSPALPAGWESSYATTRAIGDAWYRSLRSVALLVPSAITGELNCLINSTHKDFDLHWVTGGPIPFLFDPRLTQP